MPKKRCQGGRRLHCQRPSSVFEEDEAEEATRKSSSKCCSGYTYFVQLNWLWKVEFLSQPISKYRNRTTSLIPFLQAINHFCTFIHSYFMDRLAFLIEGTSYIYISIYLHIYLWRSGTHGCPVEFSIYLSIPEGTGSFMKSTVCKIYIEKKSM